MLFELCWENQPKNAKYILLMKYYISIPALTLEVD